MIIRGSTKRAGIQYKNSNGGPREYYIICGQSNTGEGPWNVPADLPSGYVGRFDRCPQYKYSANRMLDVAPLDTTINPTYQDPVQTAKFAINIFLPIMIQQQTNREIYQILYSQGDTRINVDWKPTATVGPLYIGMIDKVLKFKRACFDADGVNPTCKFFLWDQGEGDTRIQADANAYQTNLTNFINNIRTALGEASLPFLIPKFNPDEVNASVNPLTYMSTVEAARTTVAGNLTGVKLVDMANAELGADWLHYTVNGLLTRCQNIIDAAVTNGYL